MLHPPSASSFKTLRAFLAAPWVWTAAPLLLLALSVAYACYGLPAATRATAQQAACLVGVGAALGLAGAAWQSVRRSAGEAPVYAGLPAAAVVGMACGPALLPWSVQACGWGAAVWPMVTAWLTTAVVCAAYVRVVARRRPRAATLLAMLAAAATLLAAGSYAYVQGGQGTQSAMLVYLGQLRGRPQAPYSFLAWGAAVAALRLAMLHEAVGHMLAGHAWAQQRGIHAQRTRVRVYGAVCLLVACAALAAGHVFGLCLLAVAAARRSVGDLPRRLWPMAALCGAIFAVWVDLACVALAAGSAPLPAAAVLAPLTLAAAVWAAPDDASIGPGCAPQLHRGHSR